MIKKARSYITIPELAGILGLSRIAVYKKVKAGKIQAYKLGKNYAIPARYMESLLGTRLGTADKKLIDNAVKKTVSEYGEVLKLLGKE